MIINYDINNKGGGASAEGCVRYDQEQTLTDEQQQQARENIGAASEDDIPEPVQSDWNETDTDDPAFIKNKPEIPEPQAAVLYTPQTLTDAQKTQALSNIGAAPFIAEANILPSLSKSQVIELYEAFIAGRPTFVKAKISMTTTAEPVFLQVILAEHKIISSRQIYHLLVIYWTERYNITLNDSTVTIGTSTFIDDTYNDGNMYVRKKGLWIRLPDIPTVNDPTVTINQGGVAKGSFTLNQSGAATIDLDAGSSPEGCLRYDQAQTLTTAQRKQAAGNLGAVRVDKCLSEPPADIRSLSDAARDGFPALWHNEDDAGEDSSLIIASFKDGWLSDSTRCIFAAQLVKEYDTIKPQFVFLRQSDFDDVPQIATYPVLPEAPNDNKQYARCNRNWVEVEAGSAENHQLLKSALSEPMGCSANTWATLAELNVPEDGAYQVSASARMLPADQSTAFKTATVSIELGTDAAGYTEVMEMTLPRSGEYGTLSVPVNATAGQKLRLRAISEANFYAQASPSAGKASATFIAAVRVGAIYQAQ